MIAFFSGDTFEMKRKKILLAAIVALVAGLFFYFDLPDYLTLKSLKANRASLIGLYQQHSVEFVSLFMALYILQTALALPGATIFSLAAGAIFGVAMGTMYAVFAATIGATLAFLGTRYLFRDVVRKRFGARLEKINRELEREGFNYLLFLRLVPLFPFFMINLASGMTDIRLRTFLAGTALGIIPGGFVYCNAGASLASINSPGDIVSPRTVGSLVLIGLFSLLPVLYRKIRNKSGGPANSSKPF